MEASRLIATHGLAKGYAALTADGEPAGPSDPAAVRFCIRGAISYVCGHSAVGSTSNIEHYVMRSLRLYPDRNRFWAEAHMVDWNNAEERTAEDVSNLLARAARLAKRDKAA